MDDPNKDVILFTIVRYMVTLGQIQRTLTIKSFSSQTNAWTNIILEIGNHLYIDPIYNQYPLKWLASAGAIDGVFYWLEDEYQISVYVFLDSECT